MRMTCAPNAASHRVAPAPASCPVKSQMRMCDSADDFADMAAGMLDPSPVVTGTNLFEMSTVVP